MKTKTLVQCASIGVPLTEEVARKVDSLVKGLSSECRYTRKGILPQTAELVSGERADISLITTESVDRDGEVVIAKGVDIEMFQRNPIVTFAHKYDELPVGKAAWVKKVGRGIRAKTVYSEASELACSCWAMTQEGILKGKSIGFLPTKVRSFTKDEVNRNPEWKNAQVCIESALLLEYAVAPIPCNPTALIEAVAKGQADWKTLKRLGFKMPQSKSLTEAEVAELVRREFLKRLPEISPEAIRRALLEDYRA